LAHLKKNQPNINLASVLSGGQIFSSLSLAQSKNPESGAPPLDCRSRGRGSLSDALVVVGI